MYTDDCLNKLHDTKIDNTLSKNKLRFISTLNDILNKKKSGHAIQEAYGDGRGAKLWQESVKASDPKVQYTFQSEVDAINNGLADITEIINNDPDFNKDSLLIIEKGSGSKEALKEKSLKIIKSLIDKNIKVGIYSPWEYSEQHRNEAYYTANSYGIETNPLDVDFNNEDPNIATNKVTNVERPRIVMEFGSSRGNIPVSETDPRSFAEQTYTELQRRFKQDRKNCRDGGLLILGTDANNDISASEAYATSEVTKFIENIMHRGLNEDVLTNNFDPSTLNYEPIWDSKNHTVKHTLVAKETQHFGLLDLENNFQPARVEENDHLVLSHSIKWPVDKIISAAESQGFKCLNVYWGEDKRVPIYLFKAVPVEPTLTVVSSS